MDRARQDFKTAGVDLVLIGQGTARQAAEFRRRQGIQLPVLADHDRVSYKASGPKVGGVTDLSARRPSPRASWRPRAPGGRRPARSATPRSSAARSWSAGWLASRGRIIAQDASDNAPPEEILAAVRDAVA